MKLKSKLKSKLKLKNQTTAVLLCIMCIATVVGLLTTTVHAAATIESAEIIISHPTHLSAPDTAFMLYGGTCQLDTSYSSEGYKNGLRWKDIASGKVMSESDTFVGGRQYELSICLLAKTGYAFSASKTVVNINMEKASLTVNDVNHARVSITFTAESLYINSLNITGVEPPEADKTPDTTLIPAEDTYTTGNAVWTDLTGDAQILPTTLYKAGHTYKLTIEASAKAGYEFPQSTKVYINGKEAKITENSVTKIKAELEFPTVTEKTPTHTHTVSPWRTTQAYHYTVCTTCGEFLDQEDHKGGVATCAEMGKCAVCGYAYIDTHENHTPDTSEWIARGEMYHYHLCKICGAHCDTTEHVAGPAGTPDAAVVCKDCGYIITPAKGHEHKFTKVEMKPATCSQPGNIEYYICDGCSSLFADTAEMTKITDTVIPPLGHKISDSWSCDDGYHWRTCTVCKLNLTETKAAHVYENGKCIDCKKDMTSETNLVGDHSKNDGKELLPPWALLLIGLGAIDVGIIAGIILGKRKK